MSRIIDNKNLVQYMVNKINISDNIKTTFDRDDLVSIGTIGLIKADKTFDDDKKTTFATYACICIRNEIFMALRKENRKPYTDSLNTEFSLSSSKPVQLIEMVASDGDFTTDVINNITLHDLIDKLKPLQRVCICYNYGLFGYERLTQEKIAGIIGHNQSYVSKTIKMALQDMRAMYKED